MATADELLMTTAESNEEILLVDLNTRVISIPATLRILGVESDDDVKRLQFKIPKYYGEFDLSTFNIQVNFENARGQGDLYPIKDLEVTEDNFITFSWLVDRTAFNYPGDVKFSLCMKLFDNAGIVVKELNTTFTSLPVLEGLETEKAIVEQNPSAFDVVLYRLYAVEAATGNGQGGYYSVVKVTQSEDGVLFTIVNQVGETIAYVRHGSDGYSPVRGVDYWTEEDKSEIQAHAKAYVDNWAPIYTTATLTASGWTDNAQTVEVPGVTANSIVFVSPATNHKYSYMTYSACAIRCVSQGVSSLAFECDTTPIDSVKVNIAIYNSSENVGGSLTVTDDGDGNVTIT